MKIRKRLGNFHFKRGGLPHFCIKQGGQALRRAAHYMGGESKKLGYIEEVLSHAPPTMINPGNNKKVGEIGTSWVFSLRNQVDAIFKNNQ